MPWLPLLIVSLTAAAQPQITAAPAGPYHFEGSRILDSKGRPFLIRGTTLPPISLKVPSQAFSRTTLITLRQRMNMNAVRLQIDPAQYQSSPRYRTFVKQVIKKANELELLAILDPSVSLDFESNPNVLFLPTLSAAFNSLPLSVPGDVPMLVTGLDPDLAHAGPECSAFPSDPGAASKLLEDLLTDFDRRAVNWTISTMEPGKLIDNYVGYDWSKLDGGWTCGQPYSGAGIGMALLSHLWNADAHGVFTVNQPAGGLVIARGANASAYGRILARQESFGNSFRLSNISIHVTDSRGVSRPAPLSWTGAGWSSTNLVIPENSAIGPAEVTIWRTDGSRTSSRIIIANAAPGLWTLTGDGRGPADAKVLSDGTLRIEGTGFRFAKQVRVLIDGRPVPVQSFGPEPSSSRDFVTIKASAVRGEQDLYLIADGRLSNVVRISFKPATNFPTTATPHPPQPNPDSHGGETPPDPPKIVLGRYLFYDRRMSVNNSTSCATCHRQELAFTDGRARAMGATEQLHPRSAMSLVNLTYNRTFNWNDPAVRTLEQQALKPMRSTSPVELGLDEPKFLQLLGTDETYRPLFRKAFPQDSNPFTVRNVTRALAAFERSITSMNSPWDHFHRGGDPSAISESAKRGEILFFLDGGPSCFRCHSGANFSDSAYHNNGLGMAGKFKTPTLRNVAVTAPYMHDGSLATLEQVVEHYSTGGKAGHDPVMRGFRVTERNRTDLVEFLKSLTDVNLLRDERYSDPWPSTAPGRPRASN